jgi:hypothetical protein
MALKRSPPNSYQARQRYQPGERSSVEMPTVNYGDSLREIHAGLIAEWEAVDEDKRGPKPELFVIPELEHVSVTYPDEWLLRHEDLFNEGRAIPNGTPSEMTRNIYAAVNLCTQFEGIDLDDIGKMPLRYRQFFQWLAGQVLTDYYKAMTVPNG